MAGPGGQETNEYLIENDIVPFIRITSDDGGFDFLSDYGLLCYTIYLLMFRKDNQFFGM